MDSEYTEEERIARRSGELRRVLFSKEEPLDWVGFLADSKGTAYLSLTSYGTALAMVTPKTIRYRHGTVYKDIFDEFAKETKRKVFIVDTFRCRRNFGRTSFNNFASLSGLIPEPRISERRPNNFFSESFIERDQRLTREIDVDVAPVGMSLDEATFMEGVNRLVQN